MPTTGSTARSTPAQARILIASDSVVEAQQIERLLAEHHEDLRCSTNSELAVQDFESYKPAVLVLAFDTLENTKNYCLRLHRSTSLIPGHPHRTVALCTKEEVRAAFELCKQRYFDDYVLFWPMVQDGLRLPMSVWSAAREMTGDPNPSPQRDEWVGHLKHLQALETTLASEWPTADDRAGIARNSLAELERNLAAASDEFAERLVRHGAGSLREELARLKDRQIEYARRVATQAVEPLGSWASDLKRRLEPALAGTRVLAEHVRAIRPIVMVIEDDDMSQELIARALGSEAYQLLFFGDGAAALRELQRVKPDAILMDIRLPGVDGVTLTRRLKASAPLAGIPVIMMTGDARADTLRASIGAGASYFIVKPFSAASLTSKLEQVIIR